MRASCKSALLLVASACNRFYGIGDTNPIDARYFDARPSMCPAIGTIPSFSANAQQVVSQDCRAYTTSSTANRAMAECPAGISEGVIDGPLFPVTSFVNGTYPQLGPDGDLAVVPNQQAQVAQHRRVNGRWELAETFGTDVSTVSTPSRGPMRVMVADSNTIRELAFDGSVVDTYAAGELTGGGAISTMDLSPDGLRLITSSSGVSHYADRTSTGEHFIDRGLLGGDGAFPFMTEDCGALYYFTLNSVWRSDQIP